MITEDQKQRALRIFSSIKDHYDDKMSDMRQKWQEYYKNYRGILDHAKYKGSANLFIMETFNAVETLVSRIRRLVLSADPPYDVDYEGPTLGDPERDAVKERSNIVKAFLAKQHRNAGLNKQVDMMVRSMGIYGTGIMKYMWDYKTRDITKDGVKERKIDYDDVAFDVKDVFNMYLIGEGETVDDLEGVMERMETVKSELEKNEKKTTGKGKNKKVEGIYSNLDEVLDNPELGQNADASKRAYRKNDLRAAPSELDSNAVGVELFELWIDFDIDGNGEKVPCVIAIANGIVIRLERNPYWHQKKPYIICPFVPILGEAWGIGLAELVYSDQAQVNDIYNQMMDDATFTLHNMWLRRTSCPTLKSQLRAAPNKVFEVSDIDRDLKPLPTAGGAIMSTAIQAARLVKDNINNTSGAQPILQGQPLRSRTTATEVSGQEKHGLAKIVDIADRFSERVIKKIVEMTWEMDKQFLDRFDFVGIETDAGETFKKMQASDLDFDYRFKVVGAMDVENQMVRQQQLIGFLNILRGFPIQAMATPIFHILRRVWEAFGYTDANKVIPPEVETLTKQMVGAPPLGGDRPGQLGERAGGAGGGGPTSSPVNEQANIMGAAQNQRL